MSKSFRMFKNLEKIIRKRRLTFADYKKGVHLGQKIEKRRRKNYLKAKSMLSQGRKSVFVGNALYYWEKDKKTIVALEPDFNAMRRVIEMIQKSAAQYESNN